MKNFRIINQPVRKAERKGLNYEGLNKVSLCSSFASVSPLVQGV